MILQIASPCSGVCTIDEQTQTCRGCYRNIDEITRWSSMDDDEKLSVLSALIERRGLTSDTASDDRSDDRGDAASKYPTAPDRMTGP